MLKGNQFGTWIEDGQLNRPMLQSAYWER